MATVEYTAVCQRIDRSVLMSNQNNRSANKSSQVSPTLAFDPDLPPFSQRLIAWQKRAGRHDLPWQGTRQPYLVWLSEIMLQQTQVGTVIPYFQRLISQYPDVFSLAAAPEIAVMSLWSGLGYYARARNLHACAKLVVGQYGGQFPTSADTLATLPGIGRSTANAIAVFCFQARRPILDGNVKRLLCRHAGISGYPGQAEVEKSLWQLAKTLLPAPSPAAPNDEPWACATYIQAQMDLGATVCTRSKPQCPICPVAADCVAHLSQRTAELPTRKPRLAQPIKAVQLLLLRHHETIYLVPRPPTGIWGGLWSLPEIASPDELTNAITRLGYRLEQATPLTPVRHDLTHFRLILQPLLCEVVPDPTQLAAAEATGRWLTREQCAAMPLPTPIRRLLSVI